jgi:hypothetical protein
VRGALDRLLTEQTAGDQSCRGSMTVNEALHMCCIENGLLA